MRSSPRTARSPRPDRTLPLLLDERLEPLPLGHALGGNLDAPPDAIPAPQREQGGREVAADAGEELAGAERGRLAILVVGVLAHERRHERDRVVVVGQAAQRPARDARALLGVLAGARGVRACRRRARARRAAPRDRRRRARPPRARAGCARRACRPAWRSADPTPMHGAHSGSATARAPSSRASRSAATAPSPASSRSSSSRTRSAESSAMRGAAAAISCRVPASGSRPSTLQRTRPRRMRSGSSRKALSCTARSTPARDPRGRRTDRSTRRCGRRAPSR